jgi:hypothetical protein
MPSTITLEDLRTAVKQKAGMENSSFIATDELDRLINESWAELYETLALEFAERFLVSQEVTVVTDDEGIIDFPYWKLNGLDRLEGSDYVEVRPFMLSERNQDPRNMGTVSYLLANEGISFFPREDAPGTYRMFYTPYCPELVDDADEVSMPHAWQQLIVVDSAIKCLAKEESNNPDYLIEKAGLLERIRRSERTKDYSFPKRVRDVTLPDINSYRRLF